MPAQTTSVKATGPVATTTSKKITTARRAVERLRLEASGADASAIAIWEASNAVADLESAAAGAQVRTARNAARLMDLTLLIVAALTMGFSLRNIHDFAYDHGVQDPIAWFVAPAVDLALIAALMGDAVLSRHTLEAGVWATRLRWFAGAATLALNVWEAVTLRDPAGIVLHAVPPVLLFLLAEAASPYRVKFTETVARAAAQVHAEGHALALPEGSPSQVGAVFPPADEVYDLEAEPEDDTRERLSVEEARRAILAGWAAGDSVRTTAEAATRSTTYVQKQFKALGEERGARPVPGQLSIA